MERLLDLYTAGELPKMGFSKHYNPLHEQAQQLEGQIPKLNSEIKKLHEQMTNGDSAIQEAKQVQARWETMTIQEKRNIVESVLEVIIIGTEEIEVKLKRLPHMVDSLEKSPDSFESIIKDEHMDKDSWTLQA